MRTELNSCQPVLLIITLAINLLTIVIANAHTICMCYCDLCLIKCLLGGVPGDMLTLVLQAWRQRSLLIFPCLLLSGCQVVGILLLTHLVVALYKLILPHILAQAHIDRATLLIQFFLGEGFRAISRCLFVLFRL